MTGVAVRKFIKKEQLHLYPKDITTWSFIKRQCAKPFADFTGRCFLDAKIHKSIARLKKEDPNLIIGETHCHSTYSDGLHSVQSILHRASLLGLDYVVITDHLLPGKYLIKSVIGSLNEQVRCINEWDLPNNPVKIYPAFEISAQDGHLVLIFNPEYLSPKKVSDISLQFSEFDYQFASMVDIIPRIAPFGGISIVAHPNKKRAYPFGVPIKWVKENLIGLVDGIEDISSGHGYQENHSHALGLASIGSSDDHFNLLMGTAVTAYDRSLHSDLISAVKSRETKAINVDNSLQSLLTVARHVL